MIQFVSFLCIDQLILTDCWIIYDLMAIKEFEDGDLLEKFVVIVESDVCFYTVEIVCLRKLCDSNLFVFFCINLLMLIDCWIIYDL